MSDPPSDLLPDKVRQGLSRLAALPASVRSIGWLSFLEIAFAVVLSAAGLGSAWSSQEMRLWGGVQAEEYARTSALRGSASRLRAAADARRNIEIGLFSQWLNAKVTGQEALANAYRRRFPPAFSRTFEAWLALRPLENPSAPASPFHMAGTDPDGREAERTEERAEAAFRNAQNANRVSDLFGQVNVIFATAMFISGIGNHFDGRRVRAVLMTVGLLCCVIGFWRMGHLPALFTR
ncbi:MAG TPA: hypothetical protein PLO65_03890 [Caulobacter sp.]|nr:hypothetical protein [Caulobacter sp.]